MARCLLVEPDYRTKYPNLALMKLSTKLKNEGNNVVYYKGKKPPTIDDYDKNYYDKIYITTLFTYYADITIDTINYYAHRYGKDKIVVGGIFASMMPEYIEKHTGIKPFTGYDKELDKLKPDYDLITTDSKWDDFSYVFTSRGCVNKCAFCAVHRIESEVWINPKWKDAVDLSRKNIMIHDNNLTSMLMSHFREVCDFLKEHDLKVIFDNGFDCRLFSDEHLEALKGVKIIDGGLRFAFDGMQSDGHIQKTLQKCIDNGISKSKIKVFLLFNYKDKPVEAEYRFREVVNLKCAVYPQKYVPLDTLQKSPAYVGKYWSTELAREFRYFYLMTGYYSKQTFPEWLKKESKTELLKLFFGEEQKAQVISVQRMGQESKPRVYDDISPTIQTPSGGGHLPYVVQLTERRTDESKKIRKEMMKDGKDWSPRRGKELVPRTDDIGNAVTSTQGKEQLIAEQQVLAWSQSDSGSDKYRERIKSNEFNTINTGEGGGSQSTQNYVKIKKDEMKIRRLTPVECERLQGFKDGWTEGISDTQRYKQLGNSVTTNVVEAVGLALLKSLDEDKPERKYKFGELKTLDWL